MSHALVLALLLACAGPAGAATITTLYNTGVDDAGAVLPDGSVDPHYALVTVPAGSGYGPAAFVVDSSRPPMTSDWMGHAATSRWIAPQADQGTFPNSTGSGTYTYRIAFDLAGFDPATAVIQGSWSTDNFGLDVLLNGASTGNTHAAQPPSTLTYFSPFTISTGFAAG